MLSKAMWALDLNTKTPSLSFQYYFVSVLNPPIYWKCTWKLKKIEKFLKLNNAEAYNRYRSKYTLFLKLGMDDNGYDAWDNIGFSFLYFGRVIELILIMKCVWLLQSTTGSRWNGINEFRFKHQFYLDQSWLPKLK